MGDYVDIQVRGAVANVQNLVQTAFLSNEFRVNWAGPLKGKAEKGSKGANIALGAFAQYYAVEFEIHPANEGATLRLLKASSGMWGGAWGMHKTNKQFDQLSRTLEAWFQQQGVLQGVGKPK